MRLRTRLHPTRIAPRLALLVTLAATLGCEPAITRGPYLQLATPTSVVLRWRTNANSDSRVEFGSAPGNLTGSVDDGTLTTEHELSLTGLTPNTTYYYSLGTSTATLVGDDADHFFVTPPTTGSADPTRIWVLGDSGTANLNAINVRNAYQAYTTGTHTDLILMLGDNAYGDGTDLQYQAAVFNTYPELLRQTVLWSTYGNHDGHSADSATQSGPYYDIFTFPTAGEAGGVATGTEAYYSFDHGNVHFVVLDSYESDRSPGGAMLTWLAADLADNVQDWLIALFHHPAYTKGSHNSDVEGQLIEMRENALPVLEAYGVDLVLSGHSHSYERSYLLDGHYDVSSTFSPSMIVDGGDGDPAGDGAYAKSAPGPVSNEGAVYVTAGSSGKTGGGPLDHPAMLVSLNQLGSMVLDVDGTTLDALFLTDTGAINDSFRIKKGP